MSNPRVDCQRIVTEMEDQDELRAIACDYVTPLAKLRKTMLERLRGERLAMTDAAFRQKYAFYIKYPK